MVVCICELRMKEAEIGGSLEFSGRPARPAVEASGQMRDSTSQNKVDRTHGCPLPPYVWTHTCVHLCTEGHATHTHREVYDLTALYQCHWFKSRVLVELVPHWP